MKLLFSIFNHDQELTKMCGDFIEGHYIEFENAKPQDLYWNAHIKRLQHDADIIIGMDEDCFIFNLEALDETIKAVMDGEYSFAGCEEGTISHRKHHSHHETNSFFSVFNMGVIRASDFHKITMPGLTAGENYWPVFRELKKIGKGRLALPLRDHPDDPTTTIVSSPTRADMAYHTWYAREWSNPEQRGRIIKIYEEALRQKA